MKILHIIGDLGSGGAERLVDELVPNLRSRTNHTIEVLLLRDVDTVYTKLEQSDVKVIHLKSKNIYNFRNIFKIKKILEVGEYDIVHSHLFPSFYWVALASIFIFDNKPKLVTTEHSVTNKRRHKKYLSVIEKFIYSKYSKIICISDATKNELVEWLSIKSERIEDLVVINNGIDLSGFQNAIPYKKTELSENFSDEDELLCMVGRLSPAKDQDTIIRSLEMLPPKVKLVIVGEGERKSELMNLTVRKNLKSRVVFLGRRNDVPRVIKTIQIMVISSNYEGFGLTAVEGMAAGKVVIASDVPGLNEVVNDEAMLFEKNNEKSLSDLVKLIISDKNYYNEMIEKGKNISEKYTLTKMATEYLNLYLKLKGED